MNTKSKITQAVDEASQIFWNRITNTFPEIKTGDLSFDVGNELQNVMEKAVTEWVKTNSPKRKFKFNEIISFIDVDMSELTEKECKDLTNFIDYEDLVGCKEHIINPFKEISEFMKPSLFYLDFMKQAREACENAGPNVCYVRLTYS